jgi:hypothetical protein
MDRNMALALSTRLPTSGTFSMANMAGNRRATVFVNPRRRDKKRMPFLCVLAIARMRVMMRPRLTNYERMLLYTMYLSAGAMREVQQVVDCMAQAGIGSGYEEMESVLTKRAWFVPGKVVEWRQFFLLAKFLKRKFISEQAIPDSDVAFVALGGAPDLTGNVDADDLREVCRKFNLTIDIDAFIREHDEDDSGRLEIEEFSALFAKEDGADTYSEDLNVTLVVSKSSPKHTSSAGLADPSDPTHDESKANAVPKTTADAAAKEGEVSEVTYQNVLAEMSQWLKHQDTPTEPSPAKTEAMSPSSSFTTSSGRKRGGQKKASLGNRKPLYSPRETAEPTAKEVREQRTGHPQPGSSFGSARRFDCDTVVAPLPPADKPLHGAASSHTLPAISPRQTDVTHTPRWYDRNPLTGQSPRAQGRQTLPIIARNHKGHSVVVQPEMSF